MRGERSFICWLAIQSAGDTAFSTEHLTNAWSGNSDGAGFCYTVKGELRVEKPFYKLGKLLRAYEAAHAAYGDSSPFMLHMRYATHGSKGKRNVHPHILADGKAALGHNGVLTDFTGYTGDKESDTARFCRMVLAARTPKQLTSEGFGDTLADMIGPANKLVILDASGNVLIVNDSSGVWEGDFRWYSNTAHEKPVVRVKWQPTTTAATYSFAADATKYGEDKPLWSRFDRGEYDHLSDDEWKDAVMQAEADALSTLEDGDIDGRILGPDGKPLEHSLDTDAIHDRMDREAIAAAEETAIIQENLKSKRWVPHNAYVC